MIIKYNETNKDSSITSNSVSIFNPLTNMLDSRLSRTSKTEDAITTFEIVFDNGASINVNSVCIANHNITSSVTALKIQGNDTDVWTSPSVDEDLTWDDGIITGSFTQASHRYWRIQIIDATNPDTFIELGRTWIGIGLDTCGINVLVVEDRMSNSVKSVTPSGQAYLDIRYFHTETQVKFPILTEDEANEVKSIFETVDLGIPFFITFDKAGSIMGTLYVTMDDSIKITPLGNRKLYTSGFSFREEA